MSDTLIDKIKNLEIPVTSTTLSCAIMQNQSNDEEAKEAVNMIIDNIGELTCDMPVISSFANVVTMTCDIEGAEIYYTTDGTEPSRASEKYVSGIDVTEPKTYIAKAYKKGFIPSFATQGYPVVYEWIPFFIHNLENSDNVVTLTDQSSESVQVELEYSTDNVNWQVWGTTSESGINITIPANGTVYFRAEADTYKDCEWTSTGKFSVGGDITSLLAKEGNVLEFTEDDVFKYMFYENANLIDASALVLPTTTLSSGCYGYMFEYCTSLTTAPALPATTLAYECYYYMFEGCTNLNYIKVGATSWNTNYTYNWVDGVASTGTFVKPSTTTIPTGISGIPEGWTVVSNE